MYIVTVANYFRLCAKIIFLLFNMVDIILSQIIRKTLPIFENYEKPPNNQRRP